MSRAPAVAALALVASVLAAQTFRSPNLADVDDAYHIGMAKLIAERGITRNFEWAQLSVWKESYSDRHFAFHLAMIPFCLGEGEAAIRGAKAAGLAAALAVFIIFFLMLRRAEVPAAWAWCLVLLGASAFWSMRLHRLGGHLLEFGLFLMAARFLLEGRAGPLAAIGFLFAWGCPSPHLLLVLAAVLTAAHRLFGGAWRWKSPAAAVAGLAAGTIFNPYFPGNCVQWWIQHPLVALHSLGLYGEVPMAERLEYATMDTHLLIKQTTLALGLFISTNVLAAMARPRVSTETLCLTALAWATLILCLLWVQWGEPFVLASVLAAAYLARDLWNRRLQTAPPAWARWGLFALALAVIGGIAHVQSHVVRANDFKPWETGASEWIRRNVPAGQTVLHLTLDQFPPLFMRDRERRYLFAMHPVMSLRSNPDEMEYRRKVADGMAPRPKEMAERLGGRYLVLYYREHYRLVEALEKEGARRVFEDSGAFVVDLTPGR
jgi:hypothetical protein